MRVFPAVAELCDIARPCVCVQAERVKNAELLKQRQEENRRQREIDRERKDREKEEKKQARLMYQLQESQARRREREVGSRCDLFSFGLQ